MKEIITKHPKIAFCFAGLFVYSIVSSMAGGAQPASGDLFPAGFPESMMRELLADAEADPEPSGQTSLMTAEEAEAISAAPAGRAPLDICRARRSTMIGYIGSWPRMTEGQRNALRATAASWGGDGVERCAAEFDKANGYRVASHKAEVKKAEQDLRQAIAESMRPNPVPVVQHRIASAGDCQWWRDEIERDDHEAAVATTRDLRDGWEHNRLQAANGYRQLCQ